MPDVKISDFPAQLDQILRPLGITRSSKNYRVLCDCVALICEQEDRLEAVQKEIYTPISDQRRCKWSAIQSAVRRAAEEKEKQEAQQRQEVLDKLPETLAALQAAQTDADALNVDQAYRLTLLELGLTPEA